MKIVAFITSLNIEKVPLVDLRNGSLQYHTMDFDKMTMVGPGGKALITDVACKHMVAPVHQFFNGGGQSDDNSYIAVSENVQKYLKLPMDVLAEELKKSRKQIQKLEAHNDSIQSQLDKVQGELGEGYYTIETAGIWSRLKFLFTRRF